MACALDLVREQRVTSYPALAQAAPRWTPIRPVPPTMAIVGSSLDGRSLGLGAQGPPSCVDDAAMVKQESIGDLIKIPTTTIGTSLLAAAVAIVFLSN